MSIKEATKYSFSEVNTAVNNLQIVINTLMTYDVDDVARQYPAAIEKMQAAAQSIRETDFGNRLLNKSAVHVAESLDLAAADGGHGDYIRRVAADAKRDVENILCAGGIVGRHNDLTYINNYGWIENE